MPDREKLRPGDDVLLTHRARVEKVTGSILVTRDRDTFHLAAFDKVEIVKRNLVVGDVATGEELEAANLPRGTLVSWTYAPDLTRFKTSMGWVSNNGIDVGLADDEKYQIVFIPGSR